MDTDVVRTAFEACLLTEEEFSLGPEGWQASYSDDDPFLSTWERDLQ
jgi:hypothetical protein